MTTLPGEQAPAPGTKRPTISNLGQRLLTGVVVIPVVLVVAYIGGWFFVGLIALLAAFGVMEFCALGRSRGMEGSALVGIPAAVLVIIGIFLREDVLWQTALLAGFAATFALETARRPKAWRNNLGKTLITLAAVLYVAFPAAFLAGIRGWQDGFVWLLMVLVLTWGTDTMAYFGGRWWGRTKLAPLISPKKTLEGALTGVVGGFAPALVLMAVTGKLNAVTLILIAVGPLAAILGDLIESGLKRAFQVKDSHIIGFDILPGHGGVLDRVDGLILVTTLCYMVLQWTGIAG